MLPLLPRTNREFRTWSWSQIEPLYQDLERRPLTARTLASWMADWSALGKHLDEAYWRLWVDTTVDTLDRQAERRFHHFMESIQEAAGLAEHRLRLKLLASGLQPDRFQAPLRNLRAETRIFREENQPLLTQEVKLGAEYDRIRGLQTVQWDGRETTLIELEMVHLDPDRDRRERAWRLSMERFLSDRDALDDLWGQIVELRTRIASNAGLPDYRAYRWLQMLRLDYTPEDCLRFHDAVEHVVVPAVERILERRRRRLGISSVRPWDVTVEPEHLTQLHAFESVSELEERAETIFFRLDPQLGGYFRTLRREGLLDLEDRKGKMPSSYCATFPVQQRPFVFMNAVGSHDDVMVFLHEMGHAFHSFEFTRLPFHDQLRIGTEFHEVAAMAMELLAAPCLEERSGGFYTPAEAARARIQHLESILRAWPYIAVVDLFQHWAYTHPSEATNPRCCDMKWAELWLRFMKGEDWTGLEQALVTGWHRKLHIFRSPLYYIDYGLAQLGAVQIWKRALSDPGGEIARYRQALALGGTVSLPKLFAAAGARLAFDVPALAEAVDLIESAIAHLDAVEHAEPGAVD